MATNILVETIEKQTIKPSSPTPDNRRILDLSFLDQLSPAHPTPILLFYPCITHPISTLERSQLLKQSLSQTLTNFYPFAGRLRGNTAIECNDEGAEFVVTRVNSPMSKILDNPSPANLTQLVPSWALPKEALFTSPLLLVKVNFFDCGGVAIGVCLSHKAADASTLSTFLNHWSATSSKSQLRSELIPQFVASSIFPPDESLASLLESYQEPVTKAKIKSKRLVFSGSSIDALRSKATAVRNPTRVEAVTALIWKCAIEASMACNKPDRFTSSVLIQTANIRRRVEPCLPENLAGNLVWLFQAKKKIATTSNSEMIENELIMEDLVVLLRKGIEELKAGCERGLRAEELIRCAEDMSRLRKEAGVERYAATSWCKFPMYGVDFGWGKPEWVCIPDIRVKNLVLMMDRKDGNGIEALVSLGEEEMEHFEKNQELLAFFDTSVVN